MKQKLDFQRMYPNGDVLAFDGTLQALHDQIGAVLDSMPKHPAFVEDAKTGEILNRLRIKSTPMGDGSYVWDVELFHVSKFDARVGSV